MSDNQSNLAVQSQPRRNWYLTILILGSTLFAVGGVARALFYGPVHARWLIAHAANELAAQRVDSATLWLDKAYGASKDITNDLDYWRLRFEILAGKKPIPTEELDVFLQQSIETIQQDTDPAIRADVASHVSQLLFNETYFKQALTLLENTFPPLEERDPSENNEIAYTRVIAQGDLSLALKEINRALDDRRVTQYSQLFDTKAWVLFKKGETEKALKFAQAAVTEWYREIGAKNANYALLLLPDDKFTLTRKENDSTTPSLILEVGEVNHETESNPSKPNAKKPKLDVDAPVLSLEAVLQEQNNRAAPAISEKRPAVRPEPEEPKSEPSNELANIIKQNNVGRDRGSYLHTTAVLRYHRACILDELDRFEEAQKDYYWLDAFGYTQTSDLY